MITRAQYMNHEFTHREYYAQFVNDRVKRDVLMFIGEEALQNSKDEHLNDIPLRKWDALGGFAFNFRGEMTGKPNTADPIDYKLLKEAGEGYSSATAVCIYKEAAKQIKEMRK